MYQFIHLRDMKKVKTDPSFLQVLYIVVFLILSCLIIYIPHAINNPLHVTKKLIIEEEFVESFLLLVLFLLNIFILGLYKREVARQKEMIIRINNDKKSSDDKLNDSFRYIGKVNVQIQQIKSIFTSSRFPKTKSDFKKTLLFFSERVFGIVNTDWVLFRIIDSNTRKTISEQFETRHGLPVEYPHLSNKMIIEQQSCSPFTTVISNPGDLNILVCCTLPVDTITNEERVFIQAITNEITMIFIYFNSAYYKETDVLPMQETADSSDEVINSEGKGQGVRREEA
jgi:hypothetical protein